MRLVRSHSGCGYINRYMYLRCTNLIACLMDFPILYILLYWKNLNVPTLLKWVDLYIIVSIQWNHY